MSSEEEKPIDPLLDELPPSQLETLRDVLLRADLLTAGSMIMLPMTEEHEHMTNGERFITQIETLPAETREITLQEAVLYAATLKQVTWTSYLYELDALYQKRYEGVPQEEQADEIESRLTWLRLFLEDQPPDAQQRSLRLLIEAVSISQGIGWHELVRRMQP